MMHGERRREGQLNELEEEEEEEGKEEEKNHLEVDYALGEPIVPILPGTFCDGFSGCGLGAECFFGRCQCIFAGHRLAFVNGQTKCVEEEKS
jgi:hypothetical protein